MIGGTARDGARGAVAAGGSVLVELCMAVGIAGRRIGARAAGEAVAQVKVAALKSRRKALGIADGAEQRRHLWRLAARDGKLDPVGVGVKVGQGVGGETKGRKGAAMV